MLALFDVEEKDGKLALTIFADLATPSECEITTLPRMDAEQQSYPYTAVSDDALRDRAHELPSVALSQDGRLVRKPFRKCGAKVEAHTRRLANSRSRRSSDVNIFTASWFFSRDGQRAVIQLFRPLPPLIKKRLSKILPQSFEEPRCIPLSELA